MRRLAPLGDEVAEALGLDGRDARECFALLEKLRDLAESHIRATHADAVSGLLPLWASALDKGRRSVQVLTEDGDESAAAFAASATALSVDSAAAQVSARFHDDPEYRALALGLYGAPDRASLRHAVHEVRAVSE